MTDEDESTNPGMIVAAERAILKFLRDREANEAVPEDRGTSTVNQLAEHPVPANPLKQTKTVEELAAMIHQDLSQIEGSSWTCSRKGLEKGSVALARAVTRRAAGNISRMSSMHLPDSSAVMPAIPVTFPPGRGRLATRPVPTGSPASAMTIGISRVACFAA